MQELIVIKIGGNIIDDEQKLKSFLKKFASVKATVEGIRATAHKILVHGGGKLATKLAEQLNIPQQLIDGRRITDAETLKIATMVYAGYINKNIVAQLQASNCNAVGLTGADGNLIKAHRRLATKALSFGEGPGEVIDYGFVGDVDCVNSEWVTALLDKNITPVIAPVTHDLQGQLLNTNADTVAQEIAKGMSSLFDTTLIYAFDVAGVLSTAHDDSSVVKKITSESYKTLKEKKIVWGGMIPKLDNAFTALSTGVKKVIIGKAEDIEQLIAGEKGTTIVTE